MAKTFAEEARREKERKERERHEEAATRARARAEQEEREAAAAQAEQEKSQQEQRKREAAAAQAEQEKSQQEQKDSQSKEDAAIQHMFGLLMTGIDGINNELENSKAEIENLKNEIKNLKNENKTEIENLNKKLEVSENYGKELRRELEAIKRAGGTPMTDWQRANAPREDNYILKEGFVVNIPDMGEKLYSEREDAELIANTLGVTVSNRTSKWVDERDYVQEKVTKEHLIKLNKI